MKIHDLITDTATLDKFVDRIKSSQFVCVDTEFMRENTYFPILCLIQVANEDEAAAIDPLADGMDMSSLLELLVDNHDVLKVFHAGGQDLEIFYNLTEKTPAPLFDTQIASMALGYGEQVGYANLVQAVLGHQLDKGARFTDWSRRPLDKRQLDYAIADVTYLAEIFPQLLDRLMSTGRGDWLDDEMARLADPSSFAFAPEDAWKRMRLPSRKPDVLGRLKALAAWRENEARSKDLPRGRVVKDDTLGELANHPPKKQADLVKIRGLSKGWKDNDIGARLLDALADAEPLPAEEMPAKPPRRPGLTKDAALVSDLLKLLLKIRAKESGVAPRLIARAQDLELLAAGVREDLAILDGWRFEEFGRDALDLVEGRLAFATENGKLKMTRTGDEQ